MIVQWLVLLCLSKDLAFGAAIEDIPERVTYLVEFKKPAGDSIACREQQNSFLSEMKERGIWTKERVSFSRLVNAMSVEFSSKYLDSIANAPDVEKVWPVNTFTLNAGDIIQAIAQPGSSSLARLALSMTGIDKVRAKYGYTGSGIRIGVVDTGVDWSHPDLGGCFGEGCKIRYGFDFVGDEFGRRSPIPSPDGDPRDCHGHGTHVTGIIGAKGSDYSGIAPDATFGVYKIFGCKADTTNDEYIIQALEMAVRDEMDVINLSLGSPVPWGETLAAKAVNRAVSRGASVVVSFGNDGRAGLWTGGEPSVASDAIAVVSLEGNKVSDFSSWGPDFELNLKPDVGAPGRKIFSTWPVSKGEYALLSGTSMAAPHISGAVGLYIQGKGRRAPRQILERMLTTSDPIIDSSNGILAPVARQGGGMLNLPKAIESETLIRPVKIALNDTLHTASVRTITVTNEGSAAQTYTFAHSPSASVNGYLASGLLTTTPRLSPVYATVDFDKTSVTIEPGQSQRITVGIRPPTLPREQYWIYSGYIDIHQEQNDEIYHVPYLGISGDHNSLPILSDPKFPAILTQRTGNKLYNDQSQTVVSSLNENDAVVLLFRLTHPTQLINIRIWRVDGLRPRLQGYLTRRGFVGRSIDGEVQTLRWSGRIDNAAGQIVDEAESGATYQLVIEALKPFGSPRNSQDYDRWFSPRIFVD
ncbi:subtilisin-like protein [Basidiobolus meristosporus CBS 931.73]|uniref:Subtilisin-like protein n=1 Tax=Basidiobolus meristosporus CBS 931.73 TaxID=1314790 RepID=A0A1Y1YAI5_9FUNG|nr:subtilisin-like protein [Basidiobolus meristosporus CBS 931.73]|eukprot:ORX95027.1 subtilisin-like protein [Basidiobolus meristosporus CBS 931.73]